MVKKDKGKARAIEPDPYSSSTERTPLLEHERDGSPSHSHSRPVHPHIAAIQVERARESRTRSILYIALIISLSLIAAFGLFLALLLSSFRPSPTELDSLQETACQYAGPDGISILNITDDGILVNVSLRAGIDWDRALGVQRWANEEEKQGAIWKGDRGTGADWWERLRRWTAGKMMDQLSEPAVQVMIPEQVFVLPDHFDSFPLLTVSILSELQVPLITNVRPSQDDQDWLRPLSVLALAKPIASTGDLLAFAQKAWEQGELKVIVGVSKAEATIPLTGWLSKYAKIEKKDIIKQVLMPVPNLPGLPLPGKPMNLSSLVHLESYTLSTRGNELRIAAYATLPNFAPQLNTTVPFNLPFSIHLPDGQEMAQVITSPLRLGGAAKTLDVHLDGIVVADLTPTSRSDVQSDSALSLFLQNYLNGKENPILVRGLSTLPSFARYDLSPPHWLLSTLPSISVPLAFPGPDPKPKIIQTVTIERMRISESGGKMLASGTVIAEIALPKGMESVDVSVNAVKPDITIFDGPPPDEQEDQDGEEDEYPPRAFGHIKPEEWLKATSERYQNPEHPDWIVVRAPMEDIPVEILKGRDSVMRGFVSKIVFKGGALAGIKGTADVQVQLRGVKGQVGLDGLPVKGEVWVGRQRLTLASELQDEIAGNGMEAQ